MNRIMGLDLGTKTIGVAISDPLMITAQPIKTIIRKSLKLDIDEIGALVREYEVGEIVVGNPVNMSGEQGEKSAQALAFSEKLEAELKIKAVTWDERLSTRAMQSFLIDADVSRGKRRQVIDKLAAVYILQGYMDHKKQGQGK